MLALLLALAQEPQINPCPNENFPFTLPMDYKVYIPEHGECEFYYMDGPLLSPSDPPAPLLVLFHGFGPGTPTSPGGSHNEHQGLIFGESDLIDDAVANGYYVMMHDGGSVGHNTHFNTYGSDRFQRATEVAIQHALDTFNIDKNRIYGYGFSMGGQEVLSFAARHTNPKKPMLAAAFVHSGYLSSIYQWFDEGSTQALFGKNYSYPDPGVDYCLDMFGWRKANVMDFKSSFYDLTSCTVSAGWAAGTKPSGYNDVESSGSLINNLGGLPIHLAYVGTETQTIKNTNLALYSWLQNFQPQSPIDYTIIPNCAAVKQQPCNDPLNPLCGNGHHNWDTMCPSIALDFFDAPGNTLPDRHALMHNFFSTTTLISEDGVRCFYFQAERALSSDFGSIKWRARGPQSSTEQNKLTIFDVSNIASLTIVAKNDAFVQLDTKNTTYDLRIETPHELDFEVTGYRAPPSDVLLEFPVGNPTLVSQGVNLPGGNVTHANGVVTIDDVNSSSGERIWHIQP